jgi:membrane-bound lytic murein transglycosylase D
LQGVKPLVLLTGVFFLASIPLAASPLDSHESDPFVHPVVAPMQFSVDSRLQKNVDFWVSIYTKYDTTQGLIHDAKYIDHVYEVLDLKTSDEHKIKASKKKWAAVLLSVHHKQAHPETMTPEEKKIYDLFADVSEPNKFLNAAHRKRLRFQLGQKDRFLEGLKSSGRYLPAMEDVFKKEGLPVELTRLPFVESGFNVKARSKVGASGIWQFMRSTGRLYLKVNPSVDERNDPIRAAEAAAKLLKQNFDSLRSWPLAVTAYNHGRMGMMRAVRRVGSDELEDVVDSYHSSTFGFASGNFFTELLAAIEVEKNAGKYFGKVTRDPPMNYYEVQIPDAIDFRQLSRYLKLDSSSVKELNPGLTEAVFEGERLLPAGYELRLPNAGNLDKAAQARVFLAGYSEIPGIYKQQSRQKRISHAVSD